MDLVWDKPVIVFYKERPEHDRKAFVVVKAARLEVRGGEGGELEGGIQSFFPLMGDLDYVSSEQGMADRYVLCWFDDDAGDDFGKSYRQLEGVSFSKAPSFATDEAGKRSYDVTFKAKNGKLK